MAIWLRFKVYILGLVGVIAAMLTVYFAGKRNGVQNEFNRQSEIDRKKAHSIEDAADRARRSDGDNLDSVERLRKHKRLRNL
jgi:hypothetical protein